MTKQEYLEKLSKMNGEELIEELLVIRYFMKNEENSSDEYTEKYFDLRFMYNTCKDYIAERLNK